MPADQTLPGPAAPLTEQFKAGLSAPICLTWELTYACNLQCVHCLSASGRRDPRELSTQECMRVVDELERMQVFYVNIGGGEPTLRPDFWDLLDYSVAHHVGVKFSTNGTRLDKQAARRLARTDYVDVQISIDGATADVNDAVRGIGSFVMARRAMDNLAEAGFGEFKISMVVTGSPGSGRPAGPPTPGTTCTRPRLSSTCCTTGCPRGPTCSPATPSSTSPRLEPRCRASTCAARAAWSA